MSISSSLYQHPEDKAALKKLKSVPLFDQCLKAFMKTFPEQNLLGISMADKILIGPNQFPQIYKHLPPICEKLGIDIPYLFLEMNPFPNAYTYGDTTVMITLTSGLIEALSENQIKAAIAHECGHIACRHVLYHTMADMTIKFGETILGMLEKLAMPTKLALFYWYRKSELSADRAAAVVMNGSDDLVRILAILSGAPKLIAENINLSEYIKQANYYENMIDESLLNKIMQGLSVAGQNHPFNVVRANEIIKWCESSEFEMVKNNNGRWIEW